MLVDSGNALFATTTPVARDSEKAVIARGILKVYKSMGYDAVNIGPNDIAAGLEFLTDIEAAPLMSANFFNSDNRALFLPQIIKQVGSTRYGITGVTRKTGNLKDSYIYKEWQQVLPDIIESLAEQSDFIILLSALDKTDNAAIAERFSEIRLILTAGSGSTPGSDGLFNNTLLTQTANRGRHLGHIRIDHPEYSQWQNKTQKQILELQQHLEILHQKAEEYRELSPDETTEKHLQVLARLEQRIGHTQKRLVKLTQSLPENSQLTASTFTLRHVPLTSSIDEQPQIEDMVNSIHNEVKDVKKR